MRDTDFKEEIKEHLTSSGHEIIDCGTSSGDLSVDYPDCGFRDCRNSSQP